MLRAVFSLPHQHTCLRTQGPTCLKTHLVEDFTVLPVVAWQKGRCSRNCQQRAAKEHLCELPGGKEVFQGTASAREALETCSCPLLLEKRLQGSSCNSWSPEWEAIWRPSLPDTWIGSQRGCYWGCAAAARLLRSRQEGFASAAILGATWERGEVGWGHVGPFPARAALPASRCSGKG